MRMAESIGVWEFADSGELPEHRLATRVTSHDDVPLVRDAERPRLRRFPCRGRSNRSAGRPDPGIPASLHKGVDGKDSDRVHSNCYSDSDGRGQCDLRNSQETRSSPFAAWRLGFVRITPMSRVVDRSDRTCATNIKPVSLGHGLAGR